jgi:hypothetical protein
MRYTIPQLRVLSEGELYGHYTKGGRGSDPSGDPIDQLINLVQGNFIDWDLNDPKFISFFQKTHPHADARYLEEMGGMKQVLLDELPTSNQTEGLIHTLIQKTEESGQSGPNIMDAPIDRYLDLSVRATHILRDLGIETVGALISTPASDILSHRFVGRVTIKELGRRTDEFLRKYGKGHNLPWPPATAEEWEKFAAWISSCEDAVKAQSAAYKARQQARAQRTSLPRPPQTHP